MAGAASTVTGPTGYTGAGSTGPTGPTAGTTGYYAIIGYSGATAISSGQLVLAPLNIVTADTENGWNSSTLKYTPTTPGAYTVSFNCYINGTATIGDSATACIYKNGVIVAEGTYFNPTSGNFTGGVSAVSTIVSMNGTTDYLQFYVYTALTAPSLQGTTNSNNYPYLTYATINLIAACAFCRRLCCNGYFSIHWAHYRPTFYS